MRNDGLRVRWGPALLAGLVSSAHASRFGPDLTDLLPVLMLFPVAGAGGLVAACVGGSRRTLLVEAVLLGAVAWQAWLIVAGDIHDASDRTLWESHAALGGAAAALGVVSGWLAARFHRVAVAFIVVSVSLLGTMAVAWFSDHAVVFLLSLPAALAWPVVAGLALRAAGSKLEARQRFDEIAARARARWASRGQAHHERVRLARVGSALGTVMQSRFRRALAVFAVVYGTGLWLARSGSHRTLGLLADFATPGRMLHGMLTGGVPPAVDPVVGWQLYGLVTAMLLAAASTALPVKR